MFEILTQTPPYNENIKKHVLKLRWIFLVLILIFNAAVLNILAFKGGFYTIDWGCILETSWRFYKGQKPHIDFIFPNGTLHEAVNAFFFHLFGFSKLALIVNMVLVSSIVIFLTFCVARNHLPLCLTVLVTFVSSVSFYIPRAHPWYAALSHFWGLLALSAIMLQIPMVSKRSIFWTSLFSGAMTVFSGLTKTNFGLYYGLFFFVFWVCQKNKIYGIGGFLVGLILGALVLCPFITPSFADYFNQSFLLYGDTQSYRWKEFMKLTNWLPKSYISILFFVLINSIFTWKKHKDWAILFLGTIAVAFLCVRTSMGGNANIELRGFVLALAFILLYKNKEDSTSDFRRKIFKISVLFLSVLALFFSIQALEFGFTRRVLERPANVGEYRLKTTPFKGWEFNEQLGRDIDQIIPFVEANIPKDHKILIIGEVNILYPLMGRDPYPGVITYFSWMSVTEEMKKTMGQRIRQNLPDWIIATYYLTDMAEPVVGDLVLLGLDDDFLNENYAIVEQWRSFVLMKRNSFKLNN